MKASVKWLCDYVDIADVELRTLAEAMTMSGSKVEEITEQGAEINKVVAGRILKKEHHPDADKLWVCQVDVGAETTQIVTGAQNIEEGMLVPVALHKSTLPGGVKITKGKLRGQISNGMMCSHEELGIEMSDYAGACENGILVIQEDVPTGTDIKEVLSLNEKIVEFEITSNRADCFGVLGLAREAAVTFGKPFNYKKPVVKGGAPADGLDVKVTVKNHDLCPRYACRVVKNIKIEESPAWMKERLKSAGVRPINNIVDITNFVMLEYGQPMHAFDLGFIKGNEIIVRNAAEGEIITTLDGEEHTLDTSMLVIADAERAVAVAGVMGGENSEITEDTKTLLFESANFDGPSVRITAKKLGMRTEASGRYEKGLDPNMVPDALDRACELIEMLGAGEVTDVMQDVYESVRVMTPIVFDAEKINKFLGTDIAEAEMIRILTELECKVENGMITPPTFRADLEGFADIAEEVLRFHGYDKMPMTLLRGDTTAGGRTLRQALSYKIKNVLVGAGGYEILTYSFTSPKSFDMLKIPADSELRDVIRITNPLGEENSVMRRTTVGSMLEILANNYNSRNEQVKLFEIGKVFNPIPGESLADEPEKLTIGMYGNVNYYDLKGMVEVLMDAMGVKTMKVMAESGNPTFHPGRTAKVTIGGKDAGIMGEIHPDVLKNYGIPVKAYVAEIDLDAIIENADTVKTYAETPKFPAVSRDIAMLVSDDVPVAEIEDVIKSAAGKLLEEVKLFDVYKGSQIAADKKSVAYALTLRSAEKTLGEDEVSAVMDKVLKNLSEKLGAELR